MYKKIAVILLVAFVSFFAGCKGDDAVTPPANKAPDAPNTPTPSDGAQNVDHNVTLKWKCSDPDGDALKYDVNWGYDTNISNVAGTDLTTMECPILVPLAGNKVVYWKVVAKDSQTSTAGPVWHFTTSP